MTVLIGTSGWQYRDWRGRFYPQKLALAKWLPHYAEAFQVVEVNNTFYRLPTRETFEQWARNTPDDFLFVVKMSRFLTHLKRLKDPEEPLGRFFDAAAGLGKKLGPVLIQLPPNFHKDVDRLRGALSRLPKGTRAALEFRHESWFSEDVKELLEE